MQRLKILVLTDHTKHSAENSLYALVRAMQNHPFCLQVDVATRGSDLNDGFFQKYAAKDLWVSKADEVFVYSQDGGSLFKNLRPATLRDYDAIWLRLPPPLSADFLNFLMKDFHDQLIINDPKGIHITGSKQFLTHFQEHCPPMKICRSIEDIVSFQRQFPIVLKPFRDYGGKGLIRIDNNKVWEGNQETSFEHFIEKNQGKKLQYLGVKFLKNVSQGDKRIVVVHGKIIGASIRLPAKNSWLCNVAMGGTSNYTEVDEDEIQIVKQINPILSNLGIAMYGVDTLVNDENRRVLSEINTTSIGGIPQIAQLTGKPIVDEAVDLILNYIIEKL